MASSNNGTSAAQDYCNSFSGNPVLPISSNLQCGLQTLNRTLLEPCCSGNNVQQYQTCFLYCEPKGNNFRDFVNCVSPPTNGGGDGQRWRNDAFCQRDVVSTTKQSVHNVGAHAGGGGGGEDSGSSSGIRTVSTPNISTLLLLALLTSFILTTPASAISARSPHSDPGAPCIFTLDAQYNKTGTSHTLTSDYDCSGSDFCTFSAMLDSGTTSNNRTFNSADAAYGFYDAVFDVVSKADGVEKRAWPAMSGVKMFYEWVALAGSTTAVSWTPVQYCVKGTVKNCKGVVGGTDKSFFIELCGPSFVNDGNGLGGDKDEIEGVLSVVTKS